MAEWQENQSGCAGEHIKGWLTVVALNVYVNDILDSIKYAHF